MCFVFLIWLYLNVCVWMCLLLLFCASRIKKKLRSERRIFLQSQRKSSPWSVMPKISLKNSGELNITRISSHLLLSIDSCFVFVSNFAFPFLVWFLYTFRHVEVVRTTCWISNWPSEWGRKSFTQWSMPTLDWIKLAKLSWIFPVQEKISSFGVCLQILLCIQPSPSFKSTSYSNFPWHCQDVFGNANSAF